MLPTRFPTRRPVATALLLALAFATPGLTAEPAADDPAVLASETKPRAASALLLDLVRTDAGLFAVGEHGILLRSGDNGAHWEQLSLPTRLMMTSIAAADGELWIAGHGGQILRSSDNGSTWTRQRIDLWSPEAESPHAGAPILDLVFLDARRGFAVGAFGLLLRTDDGGLNWTAIKLPAPAAVPEAVEEAPATDASEWLFTTDDLELVAEADPHLNAIAAMPEGVLLIAGERGAMFRSRDGGAQWERLTFPYDGSMFGLLAWPDGPVMAFGLRGNAFESFDAGDSWAQLDTGGEITLQGGVALAGGGALLVGNEGLLLHRPDAVSPFQQEVFQTPAGETPVLSSALPVEGGFLLIGEKGVGVHAF